MAANTMTTAEYAITQHRLGMSMVEIARLLGVGERAVRRWSDATANSPGPEATAKLRTFLAKHEARIDVYLKKARELTTRPVRLKRYSTNEALREARSPDYTVRAQDAFLADLILALRLEKIDVTIESIAAETES